MPFNISYNPQGPSVTLKVTSGPPCLGGFILLYKIKGVDQVFQLYSEVPKIIHDNLEDLFPLPFGLLQIQDISLRIVGKYGPLPNHTQVGVKYNFFQADFL